MAQAGERFANSLLKALNGQKGIVEPSYVLSPVAKKDGVDFFATNVELGVWFFDCSRCKVCLLLTRTLCFVQKEGVEKIHPIGPMNEFEKKLYAAAIPELKKNIAKGVEFATKA